MLILHAAQGQGNLVLWGEDSGSRPTPPDLQIAGRHPYCARAHLISDAVGLATYDSCFAGAIAWLSSRGDAPVPSSPLEGPPLPDEPLPPEPGEFWSSPLTALREMDHAGPAIVPRWVVEPSRCIVRRPISEERDGSLNSSSRCLLTAAVPPPVVPSPFPHPY